MATAKDLTGCRFGYWTVIEKAEKRKGISNQYWVCVCDCGRTGEVASTALTKGKSKSCGCKRTELFSVSRKTHGKTHSRLYPIWTSMKQRCNNQNYPQFYLYGGRGIGYCAEWEDFEPFQEWAYSHGYDENAPRGQCTLDRIDNDGNYSPENCRWVTAKKQATNRRDNDMVSAFGKTQTISEWADEYGINYFTLWSRIIELKMEAEKALTFDKSARYKSMLCIDGEEKTIEEWARLYGISKYEIVKRMDRGWPVEKAIKTPVRKR